MQKARNTLKSSILDTSGNFGIITALTIPVLLGTAGVAMDFARALEIRSSLQQQADAALLAAATLLAQKNYDSYSAKEAAANRYANFAALIDTGCSDEPSVSDHKKKTATDVKQTPNGNKGKKFEVSFSASYEMCVNPLTALITGPSINLAVGATTVSATPSKNAFSMHLVLDKSGSMDEIACEKRSSSNTCLKAGQSKKIDVLKGSVNELLSVVKLADPTKQYARFAAIDFAGSKGKGEGFSWGTEGVGSFVAKLKAGGSTNSTDAFSQAYAELVTDDENEAHQKKGNDEVTKYIVFMTDGDNTDAKSDTRTLELCTEAKKAKMVVYTVAFDVRTSRATKLLSSCATSSNHYYAASTASELYTAFKEIGLRANSGTARLTN